MESIKLAIKPKHPTRKAVDGILYPNGDLLDIVEVKSARQAYALLDNSKLAISSDDGKFYPLEEPATVVEQFDLADQGKPFTVKADDKFGIVKLDSFVTDMVTGGAKEDADCYGKKLNELQDGVKLYNGISSGKVLYVKDYTGFNSTNRKEQNGYFLPFYVKVADAEKANYSDLKFFVAGGSGKEVTPDEGLNVIFLGSDASEAAKKKLGIKATLTTKDDEGNDVKSEITVLFDNRLQCVDTNEKLLKVEDKVTGMYSAKAKPYVDEGRQVHFFNGCAAVVKEGSSADKIIVKVSSRKRKEANTIIEESTATE